MATSCHLSTDASGWQIQKRTILFLFHFILLLFPFFRVFFFLFGVPIALPTLWLWCAIQCIAPTMGGFCDVTPQPRFGRYRAKVHWLLDEMHPILISTTIIIVIGLQHISMDVLNYQPNALLLAFEK